MLLLQQPPTTIYASSGVTNTLFYYLCNNIAILGVRHLANATKIKNINKVGSIN